MGMKARVNERFDFSFEGNDFNWDCIEVKERRFHILFKGRSLVADVIEANTNQKMFIIRINNNNYSIQIKDKYDELLQSLGMDMLNNQKESDIKAPMPGRVLKILVKEGDTVSEGDGLIVLEAMKMENIIKSTREGVLKHIQAVEGDSVEKNAILLSYE